MTARKLLALPLAFTGGVILASFAACTETNDSHCSAKGGDVFCQEKTGRAEGEVFCTNNCGGDYDFDGCLVAEEAPADGCWLCEGTGSANCGSVGDGDSDSTDTTAESDSTDATETMDTETTAETGPECMDSSECPGELPLCEAGSCVGCGDGEMVSCASEYPEAPACDAGSGECKLCTGEDAALCMGVTPVCEGFACVGCDEHAQCPDSACNMSTGGCMDPDRVWWVDQSVGGPGTGTMADPFKEFDPALAGIDPGEEGVIHFATPNVHQGQFVVFEEQTVALLNTPGAGRIQFDGAPSIDLNQGSVVFLQSVEVAGGNNFGMRCTGCDAWADKVKIVDNDDGGIDIQGDGAVHLTTAFVGGVALGAPGVSVQGGMIEMVYTTLATGSSNSPALSCQVGGSAIIRNSLLVSLQPGAEVNCVNAMILNSALEMMVDENVVLGMMPDDLWFSNYNEGIFLLANYPASIGTAASWQSGDPTSDIEGNPRPGVDGAPDFAGADIAN